MVSVTFDDSTERFKMYDSRARKYYEHNWTSSTVYFFFEIKNYEFHSSNDVYVFIENLGILKCIKYINKNINLSKNLLSDCNSLQSV